MSAVYVVVTIYIVYNDNNYYEIFIMKGKYTKKRYRRTLSVILILILC